jgi:signal transduction histidine kinase
MIAMDLPTAFFIAGLLYLALPLTVWLILRDQGYASNSLWCVGGLAFGCALILLGMRDQWKDILTYELANWLLLLAPLLRSAALRHELHRPVKLVWLVLASVGFIAVYVFFHTVVEQQSLRFSWAAFMTTGAFLWLSLLARDIGLRERSISAKWIHAFYLALAVGLALRGVFVLSGRDEPTAIAQDTLSNVLIILGVLNAIVSNIGFLGIFIERMNRRALESAKEQARQEEASRLSDQIAQLDRRRSVGEIAASLTHELSQPMTNIYLIADRMDLELKQRNDTSLDKYFVDLNRNVQTAGDILGRIRGFIRSKSMSIERIEVRQVISDVSALLNDLTHNESVDVDFALPEHPLAVRADSVQLSQIFMNVFRNAIQATHGQTHRQLKIRVWLEDGKAHITFTDNGPGLPKDMEDKVGSAFFSTKPDGLGVGLSIAKSIAQKHGGSLSIANAPCGGAVVELQLPAVD